MSEAPTDGHFARCPHCEAVFRVGEHKLVQRKGAVRCGACREVFNAYDYQVFRNIQGLFDPVVESRGLDGNEPGQDTGQADQQEPLSVREILARNMETLTARYDHTNDDTAGAGTGSPGNTRAEEEEEGDASNELAEQPSQDDWPALATKPDRNTTPVGADTELLPSSPATDTPEHAKDEATGKIDALSTSADSDATAGEAEIAPHLQHWFNAEPDPQLDNNPFAERTTRDQSADGTTAAQFNMQGVDEYIMDRPNPLVTVFWGIVSIGFIVLLGLQVKLFFVERFAQDEAYRPYLGLFCKVASCELPPRRDPYRFTITNTRIDLHPAEPGALRITVKLLNQAEFSQPFPELQLTLTDRVGRVVGRRSFDPTFYLEPGRRNQLASGELGSVVFDLAHPHEKAVGFVVDIVRTPATT